jgi:hypothetical protein
VTERDQLEINLAEHVGEFTDTEVRILLGFARSIFAARSKSGARSWAFERDIEPGNDEA